MPPADGVSSSRQRRPTRRLRAEPCSRPALDTARGARRGGACDGGGRVAAAQMCHRRQLRRTGGEGLEPRACVCVRACACPRCLFLCVHARACLCERASGRVCLREPPCASRVHVRSCETVCKGTGGSAAQRSVRRVSSPPRGRRRWTPSSDRAGGFPQLGCRPAPAGGSSEGASSPSPCVLKGWGAVRVVVRAGRPWPPLTAELAGSLPAPRSIPRPPGGGQAGRPQNRLQVPQAVARPLPHCPLAGDLEPVL